MRKLLIVVAFVSVLSLASAGAALSSRAAGSWGTSYLFKHVYC